MKSRLLATTVALFVLTGVCAGEDTRCAPKPPKAAPVAQTESKPVTGRLTASADMKLFQPAITLFDSVEAIKRYLETKAKGNSLVPGPGLGRRWGR